MTSISDQASVDQPTELLPASLTRAGMRRGAKLGLPFAIGGFPWALGFGMLARDVDVSSVQAMFMSIFVYSGTGQMVAVDLWASGGTTVAIWLAMLLISLRYVMFGVVTRPWFRDIAPVRAYWALYLLSDQSWALMANERREGRRDVGVFVGCNLLMLAGWTGGTLAGLFAGSAIPDPDAIGLSFLSSAALVSLLAGMWQGRLSILPWAGAAVSSVTAHLLMDGYLYILIGAAVGTSIAILPSQRRLDG